MVVTTGVEVVGGRTVVVKRASGGAAAVESLRREGERLRRGAHPGVVSLVRSGPVGDGWELVTSHGGRSLATVDQPSATAAAAIVAGLASTMADLHEIGITHGRIEPSHVLLGEGGLPRLCGLGDGTSPAAPEDDVAALGALLERLLGVDDDPEPIPDRRWGARRRWRGWERRALLLLADQASAEEPGRRPTARRLAAGIAAAVPSAVPSADRADEAGEEAPGHPRPVGSPRRALAIVLAGAGVVLWIAAAGRLRGSSDELASAPVGPTAPDVQVAEPVPGALVVEDGRRYRVGQDGDHLLIGDWSCDGRPTPAVFRPSSQEVFVFDRWTVTEPLAVRPVATVRDAVEMVSGQERDGCPSLSVRTGAGDVVPVSLEGVR